jgi:hypothetical protein
VAPCASPSVSLRHVISYADRAGGVPRTQKATSLKAVMPSAAAATGPAYTGLKAQSTMVCTCSYPTLLALQRTLSTTPASEPLCSAALSCLWRQRTPHNTRPRHLCAAEPPPVCLSPQPIYSVTKSQVVRPAGSRTSVVTFAAKGEVAEKRTVALEDYRNIGIMVRPDTRHSPGLPEGRLRSARTKTTGVLLGWHSHIGTAGCMNLAHKRNGEMGWQVDV